MPITVDIDVVLANGRCPWASSRTASGSHPPTWDLDNMYPPNEEDFEDHVNACLGL